MLESGDFPDVTRLFVSMACNHCDDPVCLKGCPTRAYTKHAEYGAVLQDPDTCFGCGYCTWVCPYNAPQLDPVLGVLDVAGEGDVQVAERFDLAIDPRKLRR